MDAPECPDCGGVLIATRRSLLVGIEELNRPPGSAGEGTRLNAGLSRTGVGWQLLIEFDEEGEEHAKRP